MTVEQLIGLLDKEVIFQVMQAYDREILFDSPHNYDFNESDRIDRWEKVKERIVVEFYPTDERELYIFVEPNWRK